MRCMQPVCTSSFRTMTFGAYRAFQAWARSTRAVRNHFFLLMFSPGHFFGVNISRFSLNGQHLFGSRRFRVTFQHPGTLFYPG
jgi:hypothetical protein